MFFGSLRNWFRLLWQNGFDRPYTGRILFVTLTSLLTLPLRLVERLWYGRKIRQVRLVADPIFVVGYPRSGTTHLHNLLSQDPSLGYVTQLQTLMPDAFLIADKLFKPLLACLFLRKRPQDNVALSLDAPQEEEQALANLSPHSEFHSIFFPRKMRYYVRRYALFDGVPVAVRHRWKELYLSILKKATYAMPGRRLVLKTPANLARIPLLRELFPDAKFVHIYRNPYTIYPSHKHTLRTATDMVAVQAVSTEELGENVFLFYEWMLQKFLRDKAQIPEGNLAEVRFETLEREPLAELARIYRELGLAGFDAAKPAFQEYIAAQRSYQKNSYELEPALEAQIGERWHFALQRWPYDPPRAGRV